MQNCWLLWVQIFLLHSSQTSTQVVQPKNGKEPVAAAQKPGILIFNPSRFYLLTLSLLINT